MSSELTLFNDDANNLNSVISKIETERKTISCKEKVIQKYAKELSQMQKYLRDKQEDLLPIFYTIKKISEIDKQYISADINEIILRFKKLIDEKMIDFQDEFTKKFIYHIKNNKQKVDLDIRLTTFPKFIINNRFTVEFNLRESTTLLDGFHTIQTINVQEVAEEVCSKYKEQWITNPDLKDINNSINKYFEAYKKAIASNEKNIGDFINILELHKFVVIETQTEGFWRECRRDLFKPYPLSIFKPVISSILGSSKLTKTGHRMKASPVRDTEKNALHIYSSIEDANAFIGLIKFGKE